jgi:hypothetical protein
MTSFNAVQLNVLMVMTRMYNLDLFNREMHQATRIEHWR